MSAKDPYVYFRNSDSNIPGEAIKSKHSRSGRTDDIGGRIQGTGTARGGRQKGGGHRKADRKLLRAYTRSQSQCCRAAGAYGCVCVCGCNAPWPPCRAHRTYAEILLRHYRAQLHNSDTTRNTVIHRVAKENKGSVA